MIRPCPICNSTSVEFLFHQDFHTDAIIPFKDYYVVSCDNCGMVYANVQKTQDELDKYYREQNKYEFNDKQGKVPQSYVEHFNKIYNFIEPHLKSKDVRILDIGCSTGALLNVFDENGYKNVYRVDPSNSCAEFALYEYGIPVITDNILEVQIDDRYDLIILSATLEHVINVRGFIKKVKDLLNENGLLFISVPDLGRFIYFENSAFQQFSSEHIQYYTLQDLRNLLLTNDFKLYQLDHKENEITKIKDPELFTLFKKLDYENDYKIERNFNSEIFIGNYIKQNYKLEFQLKEKLNQKLKNIYKVIIWGCGVSTLRLLNNGIDDERILFFIDSNKHYCKKWIEGYGEIKPPDYLFDNFFQDTPILVLSYAYTDEIVQQIKKMNLKNEVITIYE